MSPNATPGRMDDEDRALAAALGAGEIEPSPGFARSVMSSIRSEANRRDGLRCPWVSALGAGAIGMAAAIAMSLALPFSGMTGLLVATLTLPFVLVTILSIHIASRVAQCT